jgi:hypothetical protein
MMKFILTLLTLCGIFAFISPAQARVDILPKKIVLDDKMRSTDITLMNLGDKTGTLRLSIISYRQDEDGTYHLLDAPLSPAFDPETIVRFSPRQFTLPPGGRQKIRISVQRPAELPDGEYRFHIKAISFDTQSPLGGGSAPPAERGSNFDIDMNVAVAIPVIVRKGDLTSTARIENIGLLGPSENQYGAPALTFDIVRTGTAGTLGTIHAFWEPAGTSDSLKIAGVGNVNVFSEVQKRTMVVPLHETIMGAGKIRIRYTSDQGDKSVIDEVVVER